MLSGRAVCLWDGSNGMVRGIAGEWRFMGVCSMVVSMVVSSLVRKGWSTCQ